MKKRIVVMLLTVMAMLVVSACGEESSGGTTSEKGQTYTFKLGHEAQETHVKHLVAKKFKEELEERSDGRMKVNLFPARQLGTEKDMVQQIETGTLDFGIISNGYMSSRSESLNGWFMPFLFDGLESANEARQSDAAKSMLEELDNQGIVGYDVFFAGNRHILMKSGAIENIVDIKGQKIRVPASPVFEEFWKSAGAGPTPMALPEVYTSLQTGVIDGIDVDLDALLSQKYYEIGKDLTLTNHMTFPEVAIGSKQVLEKLSDEDQQIVKDAMEASVNWGAEEGIKLENARIEEVKEKGVNVTELKNTEELQPIIDDMYQTYSGKNDVIKSFIEENQQ